MLVCAGIVYGCLKEASTLGDRRRAVSALGGGQDRAPMYASADHAGIVAIYRKSYLPAVAGKGGGDDRKERQAGLSPAG
jgi:hypothetical protein